MAGGGAGGAGRGQDVVTHVGVSAGPGSFTGLRVGMAAAKGFCFGWGLPIVPVPTLHALASRFPSGEALVCPVLDAKKKEVYAGVFRWEGGGGIRVRPDAAVPPSALPDWFPEGRVGGAGEAGEARTVVPAYIRPPEAEIRRGRRRPAEPGKLTIALPLLHSTINPDPEVPMGGPSQEEKMPALIEKDPELKTLVQEH